MATGEYDNRDYACTAEGRERDKLESLKAQLDRAMKDIVRLQAAIGFLEANPGAVALINSI